MTDLPANVYRLPQRRFDAIPGAPWVYWVSDTVRALFETLPMLDDVASLKHGRYTGDNFRFLRYWWETGKATMALNCTNSLEVIETGKRWVPYMKGGAYRKWYGNQDHVTNWLADGREQKAFPGSGERNPDFYFREGVTWGDLNPTGFAVRYSPGGFLFDVKGASGFPPSDQVLAVMAVMNSKWTQYALDMLNPTASFQIGDLARVPMASASDIRIETLTHQAASCIWTALMDSITDETTWDFITPRHWDNGLDDAAAAQRCLDDLEYQIDEEVYRLYGISDADRAAIEAELAGGALDHENGEGDEAPDSRKPEEREEEATAGAMTREELAVRWISYAVGVVLGRFRPGVDGALGRAVYRRDDFAIGSLPAPDEAEFDELVGPVERFAYVDAAGGRHVFAAEVEHALRDLALSDGIAVLDEGHPRDLPALVERTLALMLGEQAATEVIQVGAANNLRKFLEKDFFTRWHLRWYRKRPVYWPLQSARRGYGLVLFHEKVEKYTLYVLLRDYLDHKLNGLHLQIEDLLALAAGQSGAARRQTERQLDRARQLLDEVNVFAQTIDRIAKGGYQPEANWIDDGVILRLAPLWELIPIWKAEPKKYWERLEQGDYDWSHIAMAYWLARVRAACRTNKSFAIAHGHEEWYEGG